MAMSEEVKARLRAAGEAKKGRSTIAGYTQDGWTDALVNVAGKAEEKSGLMIARNTLDRVFKERGEGDNAELPMVPWVRLRNVPATRVNDLRRLLPHAMIGFMQWNGKESVRAVVPVFRSRDIRVLLTTLFGDKWLEVARKNCTGVTDKYVKANPGDSLGKNEYAAREWHGPKTAEAIEQLFSFVEKS